MGMIKKKVTIYWGRVLTRLPGLCILRSASNGNGQAAGAMGLQGACYIGLSRFKLVQPQEQNNI